jgi:hypothetical protein
VVVESQVLVAVAHHQQDKEMQAVLEAMVAHQYSMAVVVEVAQGLRVQPQHLALFMVLVVQV